MKNSIRILCATALLALLGACSDPRSTPLPDDVAKMETIKPAVDKLQPEEKTLLLGYLMRRSMGALMPPDKGASAAFSATTLGQAIDAQRQFVADQAARDAAEKVAIAKLKAEREAAIKAMQGMVSVSLITKKLDVERGYSGIEMDRKIRISFMFKNNTTKDIAGVKGMITLRDQFGDELSGFAISNDDSIKAGSGSIWTGERSTKYSLGNNKDEKLVDLPEGKFTLEWTPRTIVFTDGTKATQPD